MNGLLLPAVDGDTILGIVFFFMLFGGGSLIYKIVENANNTRVQLAQLQAQQKDTAGVGNELAAVRQEVAALRQQVTELRDTTTQYDLSFDTALQRLERRVETVEQQQQQPRVGA